MSGVKRPPVLGTRVREEVGKGATVAYEPVLSNWDKIVWEVHIIFPDGDRQPVLVSKTAEQKVLKTADAVVSYNRNLFPHSDSVLLRYPALGSTDDP